MSTIGHPLSDLVNLMAPWTMSTNPLGINSEHAFQPGTPPPGLPTLDQCVAWYGQMAGWNPESEVPWGQAFWVFRTTVVMQGIGARYASRQASSPRAKEYGLKMRPYAAVALYRVQEVKRNLDRTLTIKGRL